MHRRCFLKSLAAARSVSLVPVPLLVCPNATAQQRGGTAADPFKPSEGANQPLGVGRGIHPGRVVCIRDGRATSWDGATGHWWDDANTDQKVVHGMTARLVQNLSGRTNGKQAWDALFRSFNDSHQTVGSGYRPGERIAIKVNCNQDRSPEWGVPSQGGRPGVAQNGLPSPHAVAALVTQLIEVAGVRGEDIMIYDVTGIRNVGQPILSRIRANSNPQFQKVKFLAGDDYNLGGRLSAVPDAENPIRFAKADIPTANLPRQVTEATYLINMALLRPHGMAGVTLTAKNHFGSVHFPNDGGWSPRILHNSVLRTQPMASYNALVDLVGHRHLGGKTMLYVLDGLYTAEHNEGSVFKWASFNDHWASTMLMSQDPLAIDSVALDLLRSEPRATQVRGNADNYLHEAAQAAKPPSGTVYNPDGSGVLASLGTHEHWNNPADRKYSRNLGRKEGIELIAEM
jgi:uncharacterized protein (DUF362 family)